jgi:hypothetical protein
VNVKLIPSILPNYIPPLVSVVIRDSLPRDFEYIVITVYLSKGIQAVRLQLERIPTLKIGDYNLGYRKSYGMLVPNKYLTKTKGKKVKYHPPSVDYGHREVHYLERDEDTTFWKELGG